MNDAWQNSDVCDVPHSESNRSFSQAFECRKDLSTLSRGMLKTPTLEFSRRDPFLLIEDGPPISQHTAANARSPRGSPIVGCVCQLSSRFNRTLKSRMSGKANSAQVNAGQAQMLLAIVICSTNECVSTGALILNSSDCGSVVSTHRKRDRESRDFSVWPRPRHPRQADLSDREDQAGQGRWPDPTGYVRRRLFHLRFQQ